MANPMPMIVIDTCSSETNEEFIKRTTKPILSKYNPFLRSLSLPNSGQAYKDLSGAIHYSSLNHLKNSSIRSYSYPNNYLLNEKSFYPQTPSGTIQLRMNLLDPYNRLHSPGGSSSRYSLNDGSFFDLSESGYYPSLIKTDKKLFINDKDSSLTVKNLSINTYKDKCNDWLSHLDSM